MDPTYAKSCILSSFSHSILSLHSIPSITIPPHTSSSPLPSIPPIPPSPPLLPLFTPPLTSHFTPFPPLPPLSSLPQKMNVLVPFGSLTPAAWHSALAKGNIPKETIIAHTDFTITSAIAKRFALSIDRPTACVSLHRVCRCRPFSLTHFPSYRRLQKQQKLRLQRRSSSSTGEGASEDEDQSSRGSGKSPIQPGTSPLGVAALPYPNRVTTSTKEVSASGMVSLDSVTSGRTLSHSASKSVSSSLASPNDMQSMLALQQAHLAQQMGAGGVIVSGSCANGLGEVPVLHSHSHSHTHMHLYAGTWPTPLAHYTPNAPSYLGKPPVSTDNRGEVESSLLDQSPMYYNALWCHSGSAYTPAD